MDNDTTVGGDTTRLIPEDQLRALRENPGKRRAGLVVIAGEEIGREFYLTEPETIIGRGEEAGVRVHSTSVSRKHARICRVQKEGIEGFTLQDLASMNGTLLNGEAVTTGDLENGAKIQVGDVVFKFEVQDAFDTKFHREIHRRINYDQLTGLMTMESFRRELDHIIRTTTQSQPFTLAMTDLDGLKRVNDTYGHLAGRMIVREMGAMMRETVRPQDLAGLYGGDEAIILFPETPLPEARTLAEQLRTTIEQRVFEHDGATFGVTISQGLAEWPAQGVSANEIIAAADRALYTAKADGRNCVRPFGA